MHNGKENEEGEDDDLCKFDKHDEIIEEEGPMSEEKKRMIEEKADEIIRKLEEK